MTHYNVDYSKLSADEKDAKAIDDTRSYLGPKGWKALLAMVQNPQVTCRQLDLALSFAGVQGFPVFAIMRTYRAADYEAWYNSLPEA